MENKYICDMSVEEIEQYLSQKRNEKHISLEQEYRVLKDKIDSVKVTVVDLVEEANEFFNRNFTEQVCFDELRESLRDLEDVIYNAEVMSWNHSSQNC